MPPHCSADGKLSRPNLHCQEIDINVERSHSWKCRASICRRRTSRPPVKGVGSENRDDVEPGGDPLGSWSIEKAEMSCQRYVEGSTVTSGGGAVQIVLDTGRPIAEVARELGVNEGTLGNWVNQLRAKQAPDAVSGDERAEPVA